MQYSQLLDVNKIYVITMKGLSMDKSELHQALESIYESYGDLSKQQERSYPHGMLGLYTCYHMPERSIVALWMNEEVTVIHNGNTKEAFQIFVALEKFYYLKGK